MQQRRLALLGVLLVLVLSLGTPIFTPQAQAAAPTPITANINALAGVEEGFSAVPTWCRGMEWAGGIYSWRMQRLWRACYGYAPYGDGR